MNTASGSAPKKRKNRPSQIPGFTAYSFPPTLPADSLFAISTLPPLSSSRIFFFILLAVATLIVIAASLIILVRGMLQTGENKKFYRTFRPGRPIDAIMVPDNNERAPSEDTKDFNLSLDHQEPIDISGPERETKALPAIRELIAEFSRRLKSGGVASDPIPRNNLVKEIQENLPVWVSCELRYLSNLLCSLAQSIKESENKSGQTADTQMLRYEIERIMDEISAFEQKIPPQNAT